MKRYYDDIETQCLDPDDEDEEEEEGLTYGLNGICTD